MFYKIGYNKSSYDYNYTKMYYTIFFYGLKIEIALTKYSNLSMALNYLKNQYWIK